MQRIQALGLLVLATAFTSFADQTCDSSNPSRTNWDCGHGWALKNLHEKSLVSSEPTPYPSDGCRVNGMNAPIDIGAGETATCSDVFVDSVTILGYGPNSSELMAIVEIGKGGRCFVAGASTRPEVFAGMASVLEAAHRTHTLVTIGVADIDGKIPTSLNCGLLLSVVDQAGASAHHKTK